MWPFCFCGCSRLIYRSYVWHDKVNTILIINILISCKNLFNFNWIHHLLPCHDQYAFVPISLDSSRHEKSFMRYILRLTSLHDCKHCSSRPLQDFYPWCFLAYKNCCTCSILQTILFYLSLNLYLEFVRNKWVHVLLKYSLPSHYLMFWYIAIKQNIQSIYSHLPDLYSKPVISWSLLLLLFSIYWFIY